jgi:long-chain acyl-CoA synthetase
MRDQDLAIVDGSHMPDYPGGIRWDVEIPHIGPLDLIDEAIAKYPDRPAMEFMGKKISYGEFGELLERATQGLHEKGIGPGSRVGLFMPNTPYYPVMFYAALRTGATIVNYSIASTEKEDLRAKIKSTGTDMMVTMDLHEFRNPTVELLQEGELRQVVQCALRDMLPPLKRALFPLAMSGHTAPPPDGGNPNITDFKTLVDNSGTFAPNEIDPDSLAALQFTGGSSGEPKSAMLSHYNLAASGLLSEELFSAPSAARPGEGMLEPGKERTLSIIPFSHIFGMTTLMIACMHNGSELVMLPNPRDTLEVLHTIDANKPTVHLTVPKLLQSINEHPHTLRDGLRKIFADRAKNDAEKPVHGSLAHKLAAHIKKDIATAKKIVGAVMAYPLFRPFDLTSFKTVISGSEALPPGVRRDFKALTGGADVVSEGYGLTEGCPVSCNLSGVFNLANTIGIPLPRTEIKIVGQDEQGRERIAGIGEPGEIYVRGPQVMKAYYNNDKENAATMTGDGWLKTGDVGYLDEKRFLHYVDRNKRMIKVNGFQVSPISLENVISLHPDVAECVVVGLPDARSGQAAKALIRLKDGAPPLTEDKMRAFLAENHMTGLKMPKYIEFVTEPLLKTAVNKVDWKNIQAIEEQKMSQQQQGPGPGPAPR